MKPLPALALCLSPRLVLIGCSQPRARASPRPTGSDELAIDFPRIKVHRSVRGSKKRDAIQAVGRSRGGRTSKIHALADDLSRPVSFTLTPGDIADISVARDLLETLAPPQRLLADKAYDVDSMRLAR